MRNIEDDAGIQMRDEKSNIFGDADDRANGDDAQVGQGGRRSRKEEPK